MHPFAEFVNPHLGRLLGQLSMDKRFVRGQGCYLYDAEGHEYLDFVAAYGALPFGFNAPEIWQAIQAVAASGEPSFVQPSALEAAGELARRLVELAPPGIRYCTFANSGTEAVEAAIKLARAATGRLGILSTDNSFHGKTLGALSATGRYSYQQAFGAPVAGFECIPYGDADALASALGRRPGYFAAFLVEPIQGEGGIVVPPPGYLAAAAQFCREHGVLLVVDEIQAGLGRTGHLFACQAEGVAPDVITLAKALGGGLLPIGATLATQAAYSEEFALKHSSTFAGNTLACRAGLATLELLTRDGGALLAQVAENGARLLQGLEELARRYPRLIRAVRGRGFMLGVEFGNDGDRFGDNLLGCLADQEALTPAIASYLLNVERVRVAPTLNGAGVIRIEPPLIATREQCQRVLAALDRTLAVLEAGNTAELLRHLVGVERPANVILPPVTPRRRVSPAGDPDEGRFAFLIHPLTLRSYTDYDASLTAFSDQELAALTARWNSLVEPFALAGMRLESPTGRRAYGEFVLVPHTSEELLAMPAAGANALVRQAVELARDRGARIVGLGAYTSVVTKGGLHLKNVGVPLTTGNSYTVVAAVDSVRAAVNTVGLALMDATVAVVGATGSIGRATAIVLSEQLGRLLLIGNPARPEQSRRRLMRVAAEICQHLAGQMAKGVRFAPGTIGDRLGGLRPWPDPDAPAEAYLRLAEGLEGPDGPFFITTQLDEYLPQADLVITATSSVGELVTPANVKFGAAVCDLSRPPNVSREIKERRPDVLVIDGGVVALPGLPDLGVKIGFERGLAYACMAETMLLALEHRYEDTSLGTDLTPKTIVDLRELGERHGFHMAQLRSFDLPLSEAEWVRILEARSTAVR